MLPRYTSGARCVIVYDLDDTLLETLPYALEAYALWYARELNIPVDEASALALDFYRRLGGSPKQMAAHFQVPDPEAWVQRCYDDVHRDLARAAPKNIKPQPRLKSQLVHLRQCGHLTWVLTASYHGYALAYLRASGLSGQFGKRLLAKEHFNGHSKATPGPYRLLLERVSHVAETHPHIFIDDHPPNLMAAAGLGFTTVLVGDKPSDPGYIHAHYADVGSFNQAFLEGRFNPTYAQAA